MPADRPTRPNIAVDLRALVRAATGIGVYTRSLLLELADRNRMGYLGLAHRPSSIEAELAAAGIRLEHEAAPLGVLWQQLLLPRRLARGDVDLLWSPLLTLPLACPVPAVVTVHDLTTLLMPENHRFKVKWSIYPFLRPALERARRVVTISHATAADLRFHFPECADRLRVIYPGIDPEFRPGTPMEIEATRRELGAPEGYLFYAGTLEPRKNVPTLLDAWEGLCRDAPETPPLVLAGPYGWGGKSLLRRIEALRPLGLVHLGHVDRARLVRLFQAARVFVYPSLYEGFGLPAAEALACGVPAVVSTSSSLPEVVGDAGVAVEALDAGAVAGAVAALLADPARAAELGQRGIERAERFRWDRAAAAMEETFAEALE